MHLDLTLDCADPARLAAFWRAALGYVDAPPPPGRTRAQWFADLGLPPGDQWLAPEDPALPRLYLQRVPEPKTVKNRLHLDVRLDDDDRDGDGDGRWQRVLAEVERLRALGASVLHRSDDDRSAGRFVVLADPEGHEFCLG